MTRLLLGATHQDALHEALRSRGVRTNAYFEVLWPQVRVADPPRTLDVVVATAAALGLPDGAWLRAFVASDDWRFDAAERFALAVRG